MSSNFQEIFWASLKWPSSEGRRRNNTCADTSALSEMAIFAFSMLLALEAIQLDDAGKSHVVLRNRLASLRGFDLQYRRRMELMQFCNPGRIDLAATNLGSIEQILFKIAVSRQLKGNAVDFTGGKLKLHGTALGARASRFGGE